MAFNGEAGNARGVGPSAGDASLLDAGAFFDGVFRTARDLRIEGDYHGEIYCEGTLTVAESARVSGAITAATLQVAGRLEGQVDCTGRFELLPSAHTSAQVLAGSIVIHAGAIYEGDLRMRDEPAGLAPREVTATPLPWRSQAAPDAAQPEWPRAGDQPAANGRGDVETTPAEPER